MFSVIFRFLRQVRQEFNKITWMPKKQVAMSTLMVFVMIVITSIYFFSLDGLLSAVVSFLLKLGV
jgi:preprotein translocase subunit SecE